MHFFTGFFFQVPTVYAVFYGMIFSDNNNFYGLLRLVLRLLYGIFTSCLGASPLEATYARIVDFKIFITVVMRRLK